MRVFKANTFWLKGSDHAVVESLFWKKMIVNSTAAPEPRRLLLQALEPGMMFDGVAVTAAPTAADASHTDTASHTTASVSVAHTDTAAGSVHK